ncbi:MULTISPECIES: hypothetical protein [Burkholderia cepacia complex]|uniref:hypothetical protein n=1 Tax=Burkholderia cepacia complex TaxID=87882 RepID=UPI001B90F567|nr:MULTISPECIES: hypothetical protein [Burkholderia cepacia complex]MBR8246712.1 hypothetical protein [Burkholderia cenocepacia]MBY4714965.1 hypothetical protein [Burkholderia cepacia]MBY4740988.1 hypothetical protein [Burkholderia cepacia]MBY4749403.1 hypothetical protein [Burkholderia cepacia]MBY4762924.1 hypothetical protein [Burkholderia cepacia]
MIRREGEKLIKRSIFVEKSDYERLVKYSELKNQSISQVFRDLMSSSRNWVENKMKEIEAKNSTQGPEEKSSSQ